MAVWDLLRCEPIWTKENVQVSQLLVHPTKEEFTVLEPSKDRSVIVSVYAPESCLPVSRNTLPFRLANSIYLPSADFGASVETEFVGIQLNGSVTRFGPSVHPSQRFPQSSSESVVNGSSLKGNIQNRSVWEEMFGESTFAQPQPDAGIITSDETMEELALRKKNIDQGGAEKRGKYSNVFEGSAQSLPPTSLLFDAFIRDFMSFNVNANAQASGSGSAGNANAGQVSARDKVLIEPSRAVGPKAAEKREERPWQGRIVDEVEVKGWFSQMKGTGSAAGKGKHLPEAT